NIVASDDVKGTVTVRLEDVPWDQALAAILQAKQVLVDLNAIEVATEETDPGEEPETDSKQDIEPVAAPDGCELRDAWLDKIQVRLGKQAVKLSAKGADGFIEWVDRMSSENAPSSIQGDVDALYSRIKDQLTAVVNDPLPEGSTLEGTVSSLVENWDRESSTDVDDTE
ncbi:MAG: hypothetical protein AAFV88_25905, partial [Planctomycetota bacterium]